MKPILLRYLAFQKLIISKHCKLQLTDVVYRLSASVRKLVTHETVRVLNLTMPATCSVM